MHSFGYICDRNYYKQLGEITDNLEKLPRSGSILIGHCRLATSGNISEVDSQPFYNEYIGVAHNGNIYNHNELIKQYGLKLMSQCDSEMLLHLFNLQDDINGDDINEVLNGCLNVLNLISISPGAFLFLVGDVVVAATRKLPLWETVTHEGTYLCSVKLNDASVRLMDNYAYIYSVNGLQGKQDIIA